MNRKKALYKGKNKGELLRLKSRLRNQNELIQKSKKAKPKLEDTNSNVICKSD